MWWGREKGEGKSNEEDCYVLLKVKLKEQISRKNREKEIERLRGSNNFSSLILRWKWKGHNRVKSTCTSRAASAILIPVYTEQELNRNPCNWSLPDRYSSVCLSLFTFLPFQLFLFQPLCFPLRWPSNWIGRSDALCAGRWQSHQRMKTLCRLLTSRERQSRSRTLSPCLTTSRTTSLSSRRVKRSPRSMSRVTRGTAPRGGSGATSSTSSSRASPSPLGSAMSGASPTSATKMEEVGIFFSSICRANFNYS